MEGPKHATPLNEDTQKCGNFHPVVPRTVANYKPLYTVNGIDYYSQSGDVMETYKKSTVFESILAQNGQVTVKKDVREDLELGAGDILFLEVVKVLSPIGDVKYEKTEKE